LCCLVLFLFILFIKCGFDYNLLYELWICFFLLKAFHLSCVPCSVPCFSCYIKFWLWLLLELWICFCFLNQYHLSCVVLLSFLFLHPASCTHEHCLGFLINSLCVFREISTSNIWSLQLKKSLFSGQSELKEKVSIEDEEKVETTDLPGMRDV